MSVLNKKPFIQTLVESLSSEDRASLLSVINGSGSTPKYSLVLRNLSISTPIERCLLETKTHLYNAYKIYKSNKITFLTFGQGQDMGIYQVDYPYYERELKGRISEALTINELRRYIEIADAIENVRKGQYTLVDTEEYPTLEDFLDSDGEQGIVYLYPVGNEGNNYYQYIWEETDWISLGSTDLDLSGYIKGTYLTAQQYEDLDTKDSNMYYFIPEE